ncbi:hypothetical protein [Hyphomicrobium sp.]|uniref:hypothetical protein n=1 Tax=Hyphomicrobium sp. TaxID=82 RepID=UPI000FA19D44|nr:hypothetical protein [Hyphomicrobium sp.]RUP00655.1 MAG: hypothetical protein EKK30_00945 [Hyphomicrobium sp.]
MKVAAILFLTLAALGLGGLPASAQTIFDVEHARANYRAGIASSSDFELLRRYGRPSGYYRQYGPPPPRRIDLRRPWRYDR